MRGGGIEPPRRKAQDPKSCASASSATLAGKPFMAYTIFSRIAQRQVNTQQLLP